MIDIINAKDKTIEEIFEGIKELEDFINANKIINKTIYFLSIEYLYNLANEKWCK